MAAVIGHLLPLALAVALSSTPLLVTVMLLLSPKQRHSAPAFLAGWVLGLMLVTFAFTVALVGAAPENTSGQPVMAWFEIVLGAALIGAGVWRIFSPKPTEVEEPGWLRRVGKLGTGASFGLGLLLNIRPKALVLATAAGIALSSAPLPLVDAAVCFGVYVLIGVSSVAIPVIMTWVSPKTMMKPLQVLRERIRTSSRTISVVVMLLIGGIILGSGLSNL